MGGNAYPPPANSTLPSVTLNLDDPPRTRWNHIVEPLASDISTMISQVINHLPSKLVDIVLGYAGKHMDDLLDRLPNDYGDELRGISESTNINISEILLYNTFYEVEGLCTSIVGQNDKGEIWHGRNLDFGLFQGFNTTERQWLLTELLRPILVNVNVMKGGKLLYQQVSYAGYIGCLSCVKKGAFSISIDTRFDLNLDRYLIRWMTNMSDTSELTSLVTRMAMEDLDNFTSAVDYFVTRSYVGPSYIIAGGVNANEGVVLTIKPDDPSDKSIIWQIGDDDAPWYVLETNYDHTMKAPFFDDRRYPARDCLDNKVTQSGLNKTSLYNVLHSKPNRNRLTTYTALFNAKEGLMESSMQYCTDWNCPFW